MHQCFKDLIVSTLQTILQDFRDNLVSERYKGTDFEQLCLVYLRNEAYYRDLYEMVWSYADWAAENGLSQRDTGIDLVAKTHLGEYHAIQCKNYAPTERIYKKDIDSFFTASGKANFSHRIIITTTDDWSDNALESLENQTIPVSMINLADLERSQIQWEDFVVGSDEVSLKPKFDLREHQQNAYDNVAEGFKKADRGKLIMACGTGKTFTSLRITEGLAGANKRVLFLVPSLALLSQTLTEWTQQSKVPLHNYAVCSDSDVGKHRNKEDDRIQTTISDLQYPATTDAKRLAEQVEQRHDQSHMTVVYATYHSIAVISTAQKEYGLGDFDLIICDEAHRTTGATFEGEDESAFVRIHDNEFVRGAKRLYMTATPRIYSDEAKATDDVAIYSMDDKEHYGEEFFVLTFSEAVARELLVDYKVVVLAIEEAHINRRLQSLLKDGNNQLKVDDAAKIVGCWKALAKYNLDAIGDEEPMQRAVAFCQVIEADFKGKRHKVSSKLISEMFGEVVKAYQDAEKESRLDDSEYDPSLDMICEAQHVDGSMNAGEKESKIAWLKGDAEGIIPDNHCRILSNVRCLSEGVDIPALDAVMFLTPRNSQVDVVQSVGRVMRRAPGKKQGYVILPVVIPAGVSAEEALNDNEPYRVVWQVLNALRAHDDRFDAMINKLEYNFRDPSKMEIVAVTDTVQRRSKATKKATGKGAYHLGDTRDVVGDYKGQAEIQFEIGEIERALTAKIVRRCGNRFHWEDWANDIAKIANTHIDRIKVILENEANTAEKAAFDAFSTELRDDLNNSISDAEVIEMLAQHLITKPVFDALFKGYDFTEHNPISKAMQSVITALEAHHIDKEAKILQSFYESVQMRADGIESAEGKQRIIVELYDKFFRNAFPKMTDRLGIVYTPLEVVDFILHSVEDVMQQEFGASLADEQVHILDPFTGTGTFITRLLQSGIIPVDKLPYKFKQEIHANEVVLLAYYIAAINIEATYHGILSGNVTGREDEADITEIAYEPFEGICLTDTFQMYETEDLVDQLLEENSARRKRQKSLDIRVIIGNPPYSAGQASANDNNANIAYPHLDERIRSTYAERSVATNKNALYDSYIRAIRWASDRVGEQGVIGFVTNGGFLEANTADGMRKCLAEEFSSLYLFHLRGNARTSGELRRKERDNVFGMGTRTPIVISILVKNPKAKEMGKIHFYDIGDYWSRDEKLKIISDFNSLEGMSEWDLIKPDEYGDWLNQRDDSFDEHIVLGDKRKKNELVLFENYSNGLKTQRDAWTYNSSQVNMLDNMKRLIANYNEELERFNQTYLSADRKERQVAVDGFIDHDPTKVSWTRALKQDLAKGTHLTLKEGVVYQSLYRPYTKQWFYFDRKLNEMVYQMPRIFPTAEAKNLTIIVSGNSAKGFTCLVSNLIPDVQNHFNGQCFPLYLYDEQVTEDNNEQNTLFVSENNSGLNRRDAITDEGLAHFQEAYPNNPLTREDVFYYVYGILHSEDYRTRFQHNLSKELPCIPRVKTFSDFKAFSDAGRKLADLHLNYEDVEKYPAKFSGTLKHDGKDFINASSADFYVTKMKHPKKTDEETGKGIDDLTKIIYNGKITLEGIPEEAYDYVVNSKSAIAWVMERQAVTTHKASGIINDANDWAIETMGNPKYPLELLQRVITVSLETMKIVNNLPKLDLKEV